MPINQLLQDMRAAEARLHTAVKARAKALHYTIEDKRIHFDEMVKRYHKTLREGR
jgi:hypothetical protein